VRFHFWIFFGFFLIAAPALAARLPICTDPPPCAAEGRCKPDIQYAYNQCSKDEPQSHGSYGKTKPIPEPDWVKGLADKPRGAGTGLEDTKKSFNR
jgi:hypothetical protein